MKQSPHSSPPERSSPDTVSALRRGIDILRCFSETRQSLTATELARLTDVPRPTVTRMASTLMALGLMAQDAQERYTLGPGVVSLARVFLSGLDIRAVARPRMQALSEAAGGFVYLAVPDGLDMVLIEVCRPRATLMSPRLDVGSRAPLANSALGRAYLWALSTEERHRIIDSLRLTRGNEWPAIEAGLQRSLQEADELGYCLSAGEFHREISSVAVPIIGPAGEPMALNCGMAAMLYTEQHLREHVAPRLLATAQALAQEIGGQIPTPTLAAKS